MDQPFWAERLHRADVATKPIPRKALTEARLADALRQVVTDEALARNARELGARLREEDGASSAADIIEAAYERAAVAVPV
jgi:UDP:flavonoid glycosyltransferase YjiC (YdhE family)